VARSEMDECADERTAGVGGLELAEIIARVEQEGLQYYMALILRKVGGEKNTYQRIGVGAFWVSRWTETMCPEKTLHLV
jgi:hypothetical protein